MQIGIADSSARPATTDAFVHPLGEAAGGGGLGPFGGGDETARLSPSERAFREMASKMRSLAVQLCKGMPKPVALVILGLLPTRVKSAAVVSLLMEAALQAYLTSAGLDAGSGANATLDLHAPVIGTPAAAIPVDFVSEPIGALGVAVASQEHLSLEAMVAESTIHAPLSLRVLLALQVGSVSPGVGPMQWMPVAIQAVRSCASCRVHPAREFELLPLWFYVIDLIAEQRWLTEYSAGTEAVQSFSRAIQTACGMLSAKDLVLQGSLWDSFGKDPPPLLQQPGMQLAGRAVLLYLNHALDAKARQALQPSPAIAVDLTSGANEALKGQTATLLRCNQNAAFKAGFEAFFASMQSFSTRHGLLVPLAEFKREVVRTLLPMAPYLCGL